MKKKVLTLIALLCAISLLFAACGKPAAGEPAPEATDEPVAGELGLKEWTLESSIWSSANGATVDLTAVPNGYAEGQSAVFVVRLEGEDISSVPCQWDGKQYTSYADLNAEDGYSFFVILTGPDGASVTVEVNTPANPTNEALLALETSLEAYCHATISDAAYTEGKLTVTEGSVEIQVPKLGGDTVTCTSAELILNLDGGALTKVDLDLPSEVNADGSYAIDITNVTFNLPGMEDDHQLTLSLRVELSNGLVLTDEGSTAWFFSDGAVNLTVG